MSENILIIDDDEVFTQVLAKSLEKLGYKTLIANNSDDAITAVKQEGFDKVILDLKLGTESGLSLIPELLEAQAELKIVMLTAYSSIATAVEAVKIGAFDYICKPATAKEIMQAFSGENDNTNIPDQPHSVERLEWEHIQRILNENNGNISATARALGMHRRTLQRKLYKKPVEH